MQGYIVDCVCLAQHLSGCAPRACMELREVISLKDTCIIRTFEKSCMCYSIALFILQSIFSVHRMKAPDAFWMQMWTQEQACGHVRMRVEGVWSGVDEVITSAREELTHGSLLEEAA